MSLRATSVLPPQRALAAIAPELRDAWRARYCADEDDLELRAQTLLEQTIRELLEACTDTTIYALWVRLSNRAVIEDTPDVRAAAALAGMAMGQVGVG